ncbi:serendipity locus protein alpha isoform X2 [Amyelois transitella]|nr:serendipity locus protein alpha isoform X2 [Amyelois transitella]
MAWCINRLLTIDSHLTQATSESLRSNNAEESIFTTPMYFVNWIDNTFEVLAKLSQGIYRTDYKDNVQFYQQWKDEMIECVTELHTCVDELLVSAMTLCRYCLPCDQHVIKARCQVVLRETKALISELISENTNSVFKVTPDTLKLPIMPSNVNILIDVLKDVLYVLETNTNTALLALLVHCFSCSKSPVEVLKEHFEGKEKCSKCVVEMEECPVLTEFDMYNERLLQIGSFAVSCSSDQSRILSLRSGLSSLEALDPHLVPAVMMSPNSHHATLLMNIWNQEVQEIKNNVFLIVDPAAFAEKAKTMMHPILLELLKDKSYVNNNVCTVINIGCTVHDFFAVYNNCEPDALIQQDVLLPLLADLNKVQHECKIVSNLLANGEDYIYQVKPVKNNNASIDKLLKRLKLLYTLVTRINELLHPKENEDHLFELCENEPIVNNVTRTVHVINPNTYVNTPRKPVNDASRSIFARTSNVRSSTNKIPLLKLTKHLKVKKCEELSFSVKLDELVEAYDNHPNENKPYVSTNVIRFCETSILYKYSPTKTRSSLRRAVLSSKLPYSKVTEKEFNEKTINKEKESIMDETMSLQITDVLNEIDNLSHMISPTNPNLTRNMEKQLAKNVLTLSINNQNTISKRIWNIPVNASVVEEPFNNSGSTNSSSVSQPSSVTTLERIEDLNRVESRLSSLRSMQFETSL